jgi:hypothetical protein
MIFDGAKRGICFPLHPHSSCGRPKVQAQAFATDQACEVHKKADPSLTLLMTKTEINDLASIPVVVIICLNPREARVEVLGMTTPFLTAFFDFTPSAQPPRRPTAA